MDTIIALTVGFWLGWLLHGIIMRSMMRTALRSAGIDLRELERKLKEAIEEDDGLKVTVKVERHGDMLYAYEHPNDRFLGQSRDRDDLMKQIAQKFPAGTNVTIPKELGAELMINDKLA